MFDNLDFTTVSAGARTKSNDPISITHNHKSKGKNELAFRLSKEIMDLSGLEYQDKVLIQFAENNSICRIAKSEDKGTVKLSKQVPNNSLSAGIVRLTFRYGLPDFIKKESEASGKNIVKVKYVHEDGMIEHLKDVGQITFKLKLESTEEKEVEKV
jgi:hypothetical protein